MEKFVFLLIAFLNCNLLFAQNKYTILIPSRAPSISSSPSNGEIAIDDLLKEIGNYGNLYQSTNCIKKLNIEIEIKINEERNKKEEETAYMMAIDYGDCKFLSLLKDTDREIISGPNMTIYRFKLYPKILLSKDFPSTVKYSDVDPKIALVVSYKKEDGKWYAGGPFLWTSTGFDTEEDALAEVYLSEYTRTFVSQIGNYRIYKLNANLTSSEIDIRNTLKTLRINDLPK